MVGMLKLCFDLSPSPDPASLRCGLSGCFATLQNLFMTRHRRSLLLQRCCCSRTSVNELGCATGQFGALGFGLPIQQMRTETSVPQPHLF